MPEEERHKFLGRQFFIIEKVRREMDSKGRMAPEKRLACYYVAPDGWVYMCPPVDRLIDRFSCARPRTNTRTHTYAHTHTHGARAQMHGVRGEDGIDVVERLQGAKPETRDPRPSTLSPE